MEDNKELKLTKDEMEKLDYHLSKISNYNLQVENYQLKIQSKELELEKYRMAYNSVVEEARSLVAVESEEYSKVRTSIQERLGVDLTNYTVEQGGLLSEKKEEEALQQEPQEA